MASSGISQVPSGSTITSSLSRRGSSSSYSSDAYSPLPPGLWVLNVHGNCSRCHHHHSSARIKVNVPRNPNITTHVRCQGCREKWLAISGRNQTQLSLLSVNSVAPDPVAANVRHSLVDMVRSATAIAALSPALAGIAELPSSPTLSRQQSFLAAPNDDTPVIHSFISQPRNPVCQTRSADTTAQRPQRSAFSMPPNSSQKYGIHTGKHLSHLKESLAMRFPAFHRANLSRKLSIMKQSRMSNNRLGKQPLRTHHPGEDLINASHVPDAIMPEESNQEESSQGLSGSFLRPSTPSDTAAQFLATLANDSTNLGALSEKEKAIWVRAKYTDFKNRSRRPRGRYETVSVGTSVDVDFATGSSRNDEISRQRGQSLDLLGLGSHHGHFDTFYPVRASTISISPRTSEAETAINETATVTSGPRYSWPQLVQRERSGSPRPPSINAHPLQRLRRSGEIRC